MNNKFFNQLDNDDQIADTNVNVSNNSQGLGMQNTPFASMMNDSQTNMQQQVVQPQMMQQPAQAELSMQNSPFASMLNEQPATSYMQQPEQPMYTQPMDGSLGMQNSPFGSMMEQQPQQPMYQDQGMYQQPMVQQPMYQDQGMYQQPMEQVQPMMDTMVAPEPEVETLEGFDEPVQQVETGVGMANVLEQGSQPNSVIVEVPQQIFEKGIVPDKKEVFIDEFDIKSLIKPSLFTLGISVGLFLICLFVIGPIGEGILKNMIVNIKPDVADFYSGTKTLVDYINQLKTFLIVDYIFVTTLVMVSVVGSVLIVKRIAKVYGNKNKYCYVGIVAVIALLLNIGMCVLAVSNDQRTAIDALDKVAKLFDDNVSDALESMVNVFNGRMIIYIIGTIVTSGVVFLITCFKKES